MVIRTGLPTVGDRVAAVPDQRCHEIPYGRDLFGSGPHHDKLPPYEITRQPGGLI